jgi:hypothetical protein
VSLQVDVERSFISVDTRVALAAEFGLHVSAEDRTVIADARAKWRDLQARTTRARDRLSRTQEGFIADLLRAVAMFRCRNAHPPPLLRSVPRQSVLFSPARPVHTPARNAGDRGRPCAADRGAMRCA